MKKRWIAIYVENKVGVLAGIAGLFSGKAYNMESITVGTTEDPTISRMTIGAECTDEVFEQIKKQLNRMIDIIKVIDLTDLDYISKEVLYIKIENCSEEEKREILEMTENYRARIVDYSERGVTLECLNTEERNNAVINFLKKYNNIQIVRGGTVAITRL